MKHMNMKRFTSAAMAGALALSMSAPAFASNTTIIEGTYTEIPISVVVPETGTAQINPYGLPVAITKSDENTVNIVDQKITSLPLSLKNQGTVPLDVNASLKVVPTGGVEIKKNALNANTDKGKQMNVALQVAGLDDAALAVSSDDETLDDKLIDKFVDEATWDSAELLKAPDATVASAASVSAEKSTSKLATLGAATVADDAVTYGKKSIALFRLSGALNAAPEKTESGAQVEDPWAEADGFTATVVFSFAPAEKFAITVGSVTGGTVTANVSKAYEGDTVTLTGTPTTAGQTATFTVKYDDENGDEQNVTVEADGTFVMPAFPVAVTASFS